MAAATSIYAQLGADRILALAHAWHERCLADPVASHPFSHPDLHPQLTQRLAAYWIEALGGPRGYSTEIGDHSFMLAIHAGNGVHTELDRICVECFGQALVDVDVPAALRPGLLAWFTEATAETALYPDGAEQVPPNLPIPVLPPTVA